MRNTIFSLLHFFGLSQILRTFRVKNKEITVLMFHRVSDKTDFLWNPLPVSTFDRLMQQLQKHAHIIALEEIAELKDYPDKPVVAISFDDGYRDFYENALPILDKYKLKANHNICPGLIDNHTLPWTQLLNLYLQSKPDAELVLPNKKRFHISSETLSETLFLTICSELYSIPDDERNNWIEILSSAIPKEEKNVLMSWTQVRACAKAGVQIGSHSSTHRNLEKITDKEILRQEIEGSYNRIKEEVVIPPAVFAFPNGLHNKMSFEVIADAGYKVALLCDDLVLTQQELSNQKNLIVLPRINISQPYWREEELRTFGFHQKLNYFLKKKPYTFSYKPGVLEIICCPK